MILKDGDTGEVLKPSERSDKGAQGIAGLPSLAEVYPATFEEQKRLAELAVSRFCDKKFGDSKTGEVAKRLLSHAFEIELTGTSGISSLSISNEEKVSSAKEFLGITEGFLDIAGTNIPFEGKVSKVEVPHDLLHRAIRVYSVGDMFFNPHRAAHAFAGAIKDKGQAEIYIPEYTPIFDEFKGYVSDSSDSIGTAERRINEINTYLVEVGFPITMKEFYTLVDQKCRDTVRGIHDKSDASEEVRSVRRALLSSLFGRIVEIDINRFIKESENTVVLGQHFLDYIGYFQQGIVDVMSGKATESLDDIISHPSRIIPESEKHLRESYLGGVFAGALVTRSPQESLSVLKRIAVVRAGLKEEDSSRARDEITLTIKDHIKVLNFMRAWITDNKYVFDLMGMESNEFLRQLDDTMHLGGFVATEEGPYVMVGETPHREHNASFKRARIRTERWIREEDDRLPGLPPEETIDARIERRRLEIAEELRARARSARLDEQTYKELENINDRIVKASAREHFWESTRLKRRGLKHELTDEYGGLEKVEREGRLTLGDQARKRALEFHMLKDEHGVIIRDADGKPFWDF